MPEPMVTMQASQIAGAITFLSIATVSLAVFVAIETVIELFGKKKKRGPWK